MSEEANRSYEEVEVEKEFVDLIKNANKEYYSNKISKDEIEKLSKEMKSSVEFLKFIDDISLPEDKFVVYTDGDEQLLYENGEFLVTSSTDSTSKKKKLSRKNAVDLYIEYFIKYQINPIIKIKEELERKRAESLEKENIEKALSNTKKRTRKKEVQKEEITIEEKIR